MENSLIYNTEVNPNHNSVQQRVFNFQNSIWNTILTCEKWFGYSELKKQNIPGSKDEPIENGTSVDLYNAVRYIKQKQYIPSYQGTELEWSLFISIFNVDAELFYAFSLEKEGFTAADNRRQWAFVKQIPESESNNNVFNFFIKKEKRLCCPYIYYEGKYILIGNKQLTQELKYQETSANLKISKWIHDREGKLFFPGCGELDLQTPPFKLNRDAFNYNDYIKESVSIKKRHLVAIMLDPLERWLQENVIYVPSNGLSIINYLTLRPTTYISSNIIDQYISYLNNRNNKSQSLLVMVGELSSYAFNDNFRKKFDEKLSKYKHIICPICIDNTHWITMEFRKPEKKTNSIDIYIADSNYLKNNNLLKEFDNIKKAARNFYVLVTHVCINEKLHPIIRQEMSIAERNNAWYSFYEKVCVIKQASFVIEQANDYDCAVCCLQRMERIIISSNHSAERNKNTPPELILPTRDFRLIILQRLIPDDFSELHFELLNVTIQMSNNVRIADVYEKNGDTSESEEEFDDDININLHATSLMDTTDPLPMDTDITNFKQTDNFPIESDVQSNSIQSITVPVENNVQDIIGTSVPIEGNFNDIDNTNVEVALRADEQDMNYTYNENDLQEAGNDQENTIEHADQQDLNNTNNDNSVIDKENTIEPAVLPVLNNTNDDYSVGWNDKENTIEDSDLKENTIEDPDLIDDVDPKDTVEDEKGSDDEEDADNENDTFLPRAPANGGVIRMDLQQNVDEDDNDDDDTEVDIHEEEDDETTVVADNLERRNNYEGNNIEGTRIQEIIRKYDANVEVDPLQTGIDSVPTVVQEKLIKKRKANLPDNKKEQWEVHAYDTSQLDEESSKRAILAIVRRQLDQLRRSLREISTRLEAAKLDLEQTRNTMEKERLSRLCKQIRNEWIECKTEILMSEYHEEYTYLFHTKGNIKALRKIQVLRNETPVDEYHAYIETELGEKFTKRVSYDFVALHFDKLYMKYFQEHCDRKGWISFDRNDTISRRITDPEVIQLQDELDNSYEYNTNGKGDNILYVRLNFVTQLGPLRPIRQQSYVYDPHSVEYFYKTFRSKYYKRFENRNEVEQYFKPYEVAKFFNKSFAYAQNEVFTNNSLAGQYDIDPLDPSFVPSNQGKLNKIQMYYWNTKLLRSKIMEHYQISRIRYNIYTNKWEGIQLENDSEFQIVTLSEKWVKKNFPNHWESFLRISESGMQKFLSVPAGDIIKVEPTMDISQNPKLKYLQSTKDICVFASLASYFHYYGYIHEALNIFCLKDKFATLFRSNPSRILQSVVQLIQEEYSLKRIRKLYQCVKIDKNHDIFSETIGEGEFKLIIIRSDDNHMSHAVCINNDFIFDSNSEHCLPMTKSGIDCCCGKKYNFVGIKEGYYFQHRSKKQKSKK